MPTTELLHRGMNLVGLLLTLTKIKHTHLEPLPILPEVFAPSDIETKGKRVKTGTVSNTILTEGK